MYELNYQINAEQHKDWERQAENERQAREAQKQEKNSLLQNALNVLHIRSNNENKNR